MSDQYRSFYTHTLMITGYPPDDLRNEIEKIPGVQIKRGRVFVPWHGLAAVLSIWGAEAPAEWVSPYGAPEDPYPREKVLRLLEDTGVVKPWVTKDFLADYQIEALGLSLSRPGAMLFHPTGTGKTVTAICWLSLCIGPIVVVTKAPVRRQWAAEVARFTKWEAWALTPASQVRKRDRWKSLGEYILWCHDKQPPVVVVGWEALNGVLPELLKLCPQAVVFDESQKGKSSKRNSSVSIAEGDEETIKQVKAAGGFITKSESTFGLVGIVPNDNGAKAAEMLSRCASIQYRLATTATPIFNLTKDWWAQLDLLEPRAWGNFGDFAYQYCDGKPGEFTKLDADGESNADELNYRKDFIVHEVSAQVAKAGLPPMRRELLYIHVEDQVEPTAGFSKEFKEAQVRGAGAMREKRLQEASSRKRKAVLTRIGEHLASGHKIVCFTGRHRDCEELGAAIRGAFRKAKVWTVHGGDGRDAFDAAKEEYQGHQGGCVLVGTGDLWGTGVDGLQCTDAAFFVMLPDTPGALEQWEGRFLRKGLDRSVIIYYTVAESTEDEVVCMSLFEKLRSNQKTANSGALEGVNDVLSCQTESMGLMDSILQKLMNPP